MNLPWVLALHETNIVRFGFMLRCDFVRRNHSQLNYNDNSVKRDAGKSASVYFMTVRNRNFQSGQTVQKLHNPCTQYCVQMWHLWNVIEHTYRIL